MKLLETIVIFGLLTSGISSSYVLGMEDDLSQSIPLLSKEEEKLTLFKKVGVCLLVLIMVAGGIIWAIGSTSSSSHPSKILHPPSFLPINPNTSTLLCPKIIPLNGEFNCSEDSYRLGVCAAEAGYSRDCIEECTDQPGRFVVPKKFVCEASSPKLKSLLQQMKRKNVPYYNSGNSTIGGTKFCSYTYESKHFKWRRPKKHFTVPEIENDPEAMAVITDYFKFAHSQNHDPCNEFRLGEE